MPNYLDFLVALDDYVRDDSSGRISSGVDMWKVAESAGLGSWGDPEPMGWTGELVDLRYLTHAPKSSGDVGVEIPGSMWDQQQVQRYHDYRLTPIGRDEADRVRRQRREAVTDAALGAQFPHLIRPWMNDGQRRAISVPLTQLRSALDGEHAPAALGAAKDLVEAACKVALEHDGIEIPAGASLPDLHKLTRVDAEPSAVALARSLTATVQRLAELRNASGTGHGRASASEVLPSDAALAASASVAIAAHVLAAT